MNEKDYYKVYSEYLRDKYGEKVYKIPLSIDSTCPNRDGTIAYGGCIFCGEEGGSFENLSKEIDIKGQLELNINKISKKYKAKKFIPFFQNFTNTYIELSKFKKYIEETIREDIVGISISTRPDCIADEYLEYLKEVESRYDIDIIIELGLQTVNYHSLKKLNRGHGLSEYLDSMNRIKDYGFRVCTHMILDLPWDNMDDVIEGSKIVTSMGTDEVKFHSLYLVKGTKLANMYLNHEIEMLTVDDYIERVITFLEYLSPDIAVQRLIGRAPEENTISVNWNTSWWKIKDKILLEMQKRNSYQGKKFNYLAGSMVRKLKEL